MEGPPFFFELCPEVNARMTCIYSLSLLGDIGQHSFSFHSFHGRKLAFVSERCVKLPSCLPANLRNNSLRLGMEVFSGHSLQAALVRCACQHPVRNALPPCRRPVQHLHPLLRSSLDASPKACAATNKTGYSTNKIQSQ